MLTALVFLLAASLLFAQQPKPGKDDDGIRWKVKLIFPPVCRPISNLVFSQPIQVVQDGRLISEFSFSERQMYLRVTHSQYEKREIVLKGACHEARHGGGWFKIPEHPIYLNKSKSVLKVRLVSDGI